MDLAADVAWELFRLLDASTTLVSTKRRQVQVNKVLCESVQQVIYEFTEF